MAGPHRPNVGPVDPAADMAADQREHRVRRWLTRQLETVRLDFHGQSRGCYHIEPLLLRQSVLISAAVVAGTAASAAGYTPPTMGHPLVGGAIGRTVSCILAAVIVALVWSMVGSRLVGEVHAHCDQCNLCSVGFGIAPARTRRALDRRLILFGWLPDVEDRNHGPHTDLCRICAPNHAPLGELLDGGTPTRW